MAAVDNVDAPATHRIAVSPESAFLSPNDPAIAALFAEVEAILLASAGPAGQRWAATNACPRCALAKPDANHRSYREPPRSRPRPAPARCIRAVQRSPPEAKPSRRAPTIRNRHNHEREVANQLH